MQECSRLKAEMSGGHPHISPRAAAAVGDMAGGDIWIGTHVGGRRQCTHVAMPASRFT